MALKDTIRNLERGPLYLIAVLAFLQLFITLLTDGFTLSFDEAMWHYIGRNWFRHHLVPYAGGVDNKSPLIFAISGLSDQFFGVNYWFPRLFGTVCQSIGVYYVYKIAKQIAGQQAGMLAILFYGLSLLWHATGSKFVSFTETYEVMFIIIAVYRFIIAENKKDFFISGFIAGIGLCFRFTALFCIISLFIASLRKGRSGTLLFCTGVLASVLFFVAFGFFAGIDIHHLFTYMVSDNFGPGSATDHNLAWKIQNLSAKFLYSSMIVFYPLVLAYFIIKRRVDLFVLWLIFAFIGINAVGIYDVVHLKEVLPALSLMSAFALTQLINAYKIPIKPVVAGILILFLPRLSEPWANLKRIVRGTTDEPEIYCQEPFIKPKEGAPKKLGWWVRANTTEQEQVFVAGFGAQVQVYTERLSPTIYFNVTQTRIAKERFFQDMRANKPGMILIPMFSEYKQFVGQDMRQFIDELVARDYYLDSCMYNYNIYRIKR
jgi:4-amino-4-deoxy-L-arabinose transferase-like glycosyltransferase